MKVASVIAFFCLTMPLCAQAPAPSDEAKVVLVAPSEARIGELVRFDASESNADSFKWRLVPDSPDFESYAEGSKAVFSARTPGDYLFILAVAKGGNVDVITHTVTVREPPSRPTSNTLSEWIPYLLWEIGPPAEERQAVAAVFDAVASRAFELPIASDWIRATASMNREALGPSLDKWIPILDKIGEILGELAEQGMQTPEQHAAVWREIAQLLRK